MRAGRLKHRITIQRRKEVIDAVGAKQIEWVDLLTVWAAVEPISGKENFDSNHYASETTIKITVRYQPCLSGITAKHRIKHGDNLYNIEAIIPDASGRINQRLLCSSADDDRYKI